MSSDVVFSAVRTYLGETWSGLPVHYENETFIPPDPAATNAATPPAWLEVILEGDTYDQRSIGAGGASREPQKAAPTTAHELRPTTRGTAVTRPVCDVTCPGVSASIPSNARAKRLE